MKPAFVLRWQAPSMSGLAFWYFAKMDAAVEAQRGLQPGTRSAIFDVEVYDHVRLIGE